MQASPDRIATLHIASIDDDLLVEQVNARFALSESFEIMVEFTANNTAYQQSQFNGLSTTLTLADYANPSQVFNGLITHLQAGRITTD